MIIINFFVNYQIRMFVEVIQYLLPENLSFLREYKIIQSELTVYKMIYHIYYSRLIKILSVFTLLIIFIYLTPVFLITPHQSEVGIDCDCNKQVDTVNTSLWLDYKNSWDGEVLLEIDKKKMITFTDDYRLKMFSKGPHPLSNVLTHFTERNRILNTYCSVFPLANNGKYQVKHGFYQAMFNDESQVIQCLVQKVSSSSWISIFVQMVGEVINETKTSLPESDPIWDKISLGKNLDDINMLAKRFQTYTKFMITRNPFERLLSAYTSKFKEDQEWYENKYAPRIIEANYLSALTRRRIDFLKLELNFRAEKVVKEMGDHIARQLKRLGAGAGNFKITFLEFLNYVIATSKSWNVDYHWAPITTICNPCSIRYDILAKFETLYEDSQAILDYILANTTIPPISFPVYRHKSTNERCNEAFKNIPVKVRSSIYEVYKQDFVLFGYEYKGGNIDGDVC